MKPETSTLVQIQTHESLLSRTIRKTMLTAYTCCPACTTYVLAVAALSLALADRFDGTGKLGTNADRAVAAKELADAIVTALDEQEVDWNTRAAAAAMALQAALLGPMADHMAGLQAEATKPRRNSRHN